MGRNGFYYRSSLGPRSAPIGKEETVVQTDTLAEIDSGDLLQMTDSSSAALLAEMNGKHSVGDVGLWRLAATVYFSFLAASINPPMAVASAVLGGIWTWLRRAARDTLRLTTVLFYELDENIASSYNTLHEAFEQGDGVPQAVWHVGAKGTADWKRNAGASSVVQRRQIRLMKAAPPRVKTNVEVLSIPAGRQTIYLLPDRILVIDPRSVGAIAYEALGVHVGDRRLSSRRRRFPGTPSKWARTWKFVAKSGGPDRRFKNNRQLPVLLYDEMALSSSTRT
jgi:hypothetical protein